MFKHILTTSHLRRALIAACAPGRSRRALLRCGSAIVALVPASLALFAAGAFGSPAGDLDSSFDGDGKTLLTSPFARMRC